MHYEGQECNHFVFYTGAVREYRGLDSPTVFCTGAVHEVPNQQIEPAVDWLLHEKGREFYLIGSVERHSRDKTKRRNK